jgi:hypothetical protein
MWTAATRTPPLYPDAVTLAADVGAEDLLERIDATAGCSVKDSFATLDLLPYGFRVLFEATWLRLDAGRATTDDDGCRWELADWRDGRDEHHVFLDEVVADDAVSFIAGRVGGRVVAGAILNRSDDVVGMTNVFGSRAGAVAFARELFPGAVLCGYEFGADASEARTIGFEAVGPLRVWIKDA